MFKLDEALKTGDVKHIFELIFVGIILPCGIISQGWYIVKKNFESKLKSEFMPVLMRAIPGFYWQQTPTIKEPEILKCMIFPDVTAVERSSIIHQHAAIEQAVSDILPGNKEFIFDDCFVGTYRKVPIAISECKYSLRVVMEISGSTRWRKYKIFRGAIVKLKMNKRFQGMTVIRPKYALSSYIEDGKDLASAGLNQVILEDPQFGENFYAFASDQIEARYLITPSFMERFKALMTAFDTAHIYCSFYDDYIYIALPAGHDLFSLGNLTTPVYDKKQFREIYNQFSAILALVDYFKLDKRLGL